MNGPTVLITVTADSSGNYTWTPSIALADGIYALRAEAVDIAGNISSLSPVVSMRIDTTPRLSQLYQVSP
jgi:hypothetical protein